MATVNAGEELRIFQGAPAYWRLDALQDWLGCMVNLDSRSISGVMLPSGEPFVVLHPPGTMVLGNWFQHTLVACHNLRWNHDDLPSESAKLTDWGAVLRLLMLLGKVLDDDCPAPALVPTQSGGVQAEWHRNGVYLEIESDPDGSLEYYVSGRGRDHEAEVSLDQFNDLREHARLLLAEAWAEVA
ncbi:MAG: hypothetical protein OXL37_03620 [Chloroflexota bacterium]|nr:hypothetical protein [Chloroflexota bacterium]MDE2958594.1 hypothetical protein [Chloroflexota bacterium]